MHFIGDRFGPSRGMLAKSGFAFRDSGFGIAPDRRGLPLGLDQWLRVVWVIGHAKIGGLLLIRRAGSARSASNDVTGMLRQAMIRIIVAGAVLLLLVACSPPAPATPPRAVGAAALDHRIGPAEVEKYRSIRSGSDWKNPKVYFHRNGVTLIATGLPTGRRDVATAELEQWLLELPLDAWPYGRVVLVSPRASCRAKPEKTRRYSGMGKRYTRR